MIWKITETKNLKKYEHEIFEMYKNSYRKIGLINFHDFNGLTDALGCSFYLLLNSDNEIIGIILYWLSHYGNKISLVISKSSEIAKKYVIPKLIKLIQTPGFYIELSDALEYLVRKENIENIKDKRILKLLLPSLSDRDIFSQNDSRRYKFLLHPEKKIPCPVGSYLKEFKNIGVHRKALYGIPCISKRFRGQGCHRVCKLFN